MGFYRKKPVVIQAYRLTDENFKEVAEWCGGEYVEPPRPDYFNEGRAMDIPTLEGIMLARVGEWIIRGVKGEFYPCKHDIFEETYEAA